MAFRELIPFGRERRPVAGRGGGEMHPIEVFRREMDRLFDDFFRTPTSSRPSGWFGGDLRIDVAETDKEYEVKAELPGVDEKDVDVSLANNVLTIRGEKKSEREEKEKDYYLSERSFGSFRRDIPLGTDVDEDKIEARFEKGVLTVRLPKSPEVQTRTRRIEVKSS